MKKVKGQEEEAKLKLTEWESQMIFQLLNTQGISNVPLRVLAAMLAVRERLNPNKTPKGLAELDSTEAKVIYDIAVNPEVRWTLDQRSLDLYEKLQGMVK